MLRHRLTDDEWELIESVFPPRAKTGRPPADRRTVLDGIFWILRTGAPWRDLPEEFGKWHTVWDLFDKWNADGTLDEILRPDGYNIGLNLGRAAGAGLPGHLHWHLVPRWNGDTNFMPILTDVKVIAQSLDALFDLLVARLRDDLV